jgi:hypothetical protein
MILRSQDAAKKKREAFVREWFEIEKFFNCFANTTTITTTFLQQRCDINKISIACGNVGIFYMAKTGKSDGRCMQKMPEKSYQHSLVEISQKAREEYCTCSISSICTIKINREWL